MSGSVAVRALCEFTARFGDLDLRFTPAPTALQGQEGHERVRARRGPGYEAEISLSGHYQELLVRGRADGFDPNTLQLEEIKTYRGTIDGVRPHHRSLHWAQARIYGHLLCQARGLAQLRIALVYFEISSAQETVLVETHGAAALQAFFEEQCARFLDWSRSEAAHRQARDTRLAALAFPMERFRAGQRELAVAVYRSARAKEGGNSLMAQAPTGIGKTLGTIFPMLKASTRPGLDKLFYLTAKGTGHGMALQALATLTAPGEASTGVPALRVLDLQARDKTCEHPDKACHGESCPLARGFFDRLPAARSAARDLPAPWDAPTVRRLALAHQLCPYYLSQELALWSDVVVADYHYYYGGSALLYALTQDRHWKVGVLVDEAHNLVERARSMYTAELSAFTLAEARKAATGTVRKALDRLQRHCNALLKDQLPDYQSHDDLPAPLLRALQSATGALGEALAEPLAEVPRPADDPVLAFYWEALQFASLAESFGSHALFDVHRLHPHGARGGRGRTPWFTLSIRNVIPAPHLEGRHRAAHATVLFSGTLTPSHFYSDMLGLPPDTGWIEVETPFESTQLNVRTVGQISTRFRDRAQSLRPIADLVAQQYARQPGNYLCFVSSFDYLQQVADEVRAQYPQLPLWLQTRGMDEASRTAFLARFTEEGHGIGFAVLGGAFSEGVDLPGRRLIGAFVATLGLPQINPVNEHMKRAMDRHFGPGKGHDYTYLYPGLRKVVQAAGRVIRSEQDQGTIFLIDDRYRRANVQALLPRWWRVQALDRGDPVREPHPGTDAPPTLAKGDADTAAFPPNPQMP